MDSFLSLSKYLLNSCCVLSIESKTGGTTENQSDKIGCPGSKGFIQRVLKEQEALSHFHCGSELPRNTNTTDSCWSYDPSVPMHPPPRPDPPRCCIKETALRSQNSLSDLCPSVLNQKVSQWGTY